MLTKCVMAGSLNKFSVKLERVHLPWKSPGGTACILIQERLWARQKDAVAQFTPRLYLITESGRSEAIYIFTNALRVLLLVILISSSFILIFLQYSSMVLKDISLLVKRISRI